MASKKNEAKFTKSALLRSKQFTTTERDILDLVLVEGKEYTMTSAKSLVTKFKGGI